MKGETGGGVREWSEEGNNVILDIVNAQFSPDLA